VHEFLEGQDRCHQLGGFEALQAEAGEQASGLRVRGLAGEDLAEAFSEGGGGELSVNGLAEG